MKKYTTTLLPLMLLLVACENDIPFRLAGVEPKLTMNGFINTDSLTNLVYLNYTGKTTIGDVEDATVEVYIDNELVETAEEAESVYHFDTQKRYIIRSRFKPGDKVKIEARTGDGKHHVWAEETVPAKMDILQCDTLDVPLTVNDNNHIRKKMRLYVKFKDRVGEKNHYRIVVEKHKSIKGLSFQGKDTVVYAVEREFWPWDDLVLTDGRPSTAEELDNELFEQVLNKYGVFDDGMFKDKEYTMNIMTHLYNDYREYHFVPKTMDMYLKVRLLSITETEYYYLRTLNYIDSDLYDDYMNEPPVIPGNVKQGAGMVGFSSESGVTIPVITGSKL